MPNRIVVAFMMLCLAAPCFAGEPATVREFVLRYEARLSGLKSGQAVRVWLPVPPSNEDQTVEIVRRELPVEGKIEREPRFENRMLHTEAIADADGKVVLAMTYRIKRKEIGTSGGKLRDNEREQFLRADKLVPIGGKSLALLEGKRLPEDRLQLAQVLYDTVNAHMKYSKEGTGWGRGDSDWACDSRFGNCSDFHSLFISLARAQKMPAKFEIGLSLPGKRGKGEIAGYHCWAKFSADGVRWVPVDISEANKHPELRDYYFGHLSADRVMLSMGRDLDLAPKQAGPPLNFFVEPYAEVDGKPLGKEQIQRRATYEDAGD